MPRRVFKLSQWTVGQRGAYWDYGDTYRDEKDKFRGPYSSLASICLTVARELLREVVRRRDRMEDAHAAQ